MKQLLYTIAIIISFAPAASAQYNLGMATSNWSGIYGLYLNPANIADNRDRISIDVVSLNAGVNNSLGYINTKGGLIGAINKGNTNNIFSYNNGTNFSLVAPYAQVHLPGIMVAINHKHSLALTTSVQGSNQFNNFDQSLYRTITDPNYTPGSNIDLTSNKFNYTAQVWSQVGLTYAGVVLDQGEHEIRVGATIRYLGGIGYIGLKGHNLDAHFNQGSDTLIVHNSDLEYASNLLSTKSAVLNGVSNQSILSEFFGSKDGSGVGGDIGVVYDYMPDYERDQYESKNGKKVTTDYSKNRYKLRFSASIMDIGAITYKSSTNSNAEVTGNGTISGQDLANNVKTFDQFRAYAVSHGFTADTSHQKTKVYMPTTLRIGADYHIYRWFYVNGTFIANLANRQNFGNSYYNQLTITPRYDTRLLSVGLPITYDVLSQSMKMGVGARVGGFFVGSDDILALIASHQSGVNFYLGGFVPLNRKTPKGTLVPADDKDKEPEPDMDHGGSPDTTDNSFIYPRKTLNKTPVETGMATTITTDAPNYFFSAASYFYDKAKTYNTK